eukprot:11209967-Lingulodinium_polyedra.AAC.1
MQVAQRKFRQGAGGQKERALGQFCIPCSSGPKKVDGEDVGTMRESVSECRDKRRAGQRVGRFDRSSTRTRVGP